MAVVADSEMCSIRVSMEILDYGSFSKEYTMSTSKRSLIVLLVAVLVAAILYGSGCKKRDPVVVKTNTIPVVIQADTASKDMVKEILRNKVFVIDPNTAIKYSLQIVEPDPNINYSILQVKPDPNAGYSIEIIDPDTQKPTLEIEPEIRRSIIDRLKKR